MALPQSVAFAGTVCTGLGPTPDVLFQGQLAHGVVPDPANVSPNGFLNGACLYRSDRIVVLRPRTFSFFYVSGGRLARDYLAYVAREDDFPITGYRIESVNLVTGRYVHEVRAHRQGLIENLVLRPTGSIAWVEDNGFSYTLRLANRHGVRTPRHGHRIAKSSLRLRGSTLRWRRGRHTYSSRLA